MKNIFLKSIAIICFCILSITTNAQTTKPTTAATPNLHLQVYRNAISAGDLATAITALNYVVAAEMKTGKYQDSLALLYFATNNIQQANYWSSKVLATQPNNFVMLDIKASALKQMGQPLQAIETYEKMLTIEKSPAVCFSLTELQYSVKRLYECVATTQLAEQMKIDKDLGFMYKIEDKTYSTPLMAGFYNYRGLALFDLGEKEAAKAAFNAALKLDPNFILAKANIEAIEKEASTTSPAPASNTTAPPPPAKGK